MSTMHGPNDLAISAKARQELLSAIQEAMNMEFSNPAERGYVTQISASPLSIFLSLKHIITVYLFIIFIYFKLQY